MRRVSLASRVVWALIAVNIAGASGGTQSARAEDGKSRSLARYFPRRDLVVYSEFDGLDAHGDAWKASAAQGLLNETTTGAMLEAIVTQLAERFFKSAPAKVLNGPEFMKLVKHGFRSGVAFGIVRKEGEPKPSCIGLVLRGAGRGEVREIVGKLLDARNGPGSRAEPSDAHHGRAITVVGNVDAPSFSWWIEGDDLAFSFVSTRGADAMIAAVDGREPDAVEQPIRTRLMKTEDGFEPIGVAFIRAAALPSLPPQAAKFGFDKIDRIEYRWGFQARALMTVVRVVCPAPRSGALALLDQPGFETRRLPPLPKGLNGFTVASVDPASVYDKISGLIKASSSPTAPAEIERLERKILGATDQRLREDILGGLGPRWAFYVIPTRVNAPSNPLSGFAMGAVHVAKAALVIEVKDAGRFGKVLDALVAWANRASKEDALDQDAPAARLEAFNGADRGYVLSMPPAEAPMPAGMRPTVLLGKKFVVIASTPATARQVLAAEGRTDADALPESLAPALGPLPKELIYLTVNDQRESLFPEVVANLPSLIQLVASGGNLNRIVPSLSGRAPRGPNGPPPLVLQIHPDQVPDPDDIRRFLFPATFAWSANDQGFEFVSREAFPSLNPTTVVPVAFAMLLPAVQASRSAARRSQSVNNLKQIGLALHNYHSTNNHFPPAAIRSKDGKPLLSWRVAILPFVEQSAMFNEFKMDEAWDGPHNKAMLAKMPGIYTVPGSTARPGMTFYRGFSGKKTLFDDDVKLGVGLQHVTDGSSNTLGVVEANTAVPWTKPDSDLPFDADAKPEQIVALLKSLGGHSPGGFNALFIDGSVRFIKDSINATVFRALITRNGGEVVSGDSF